MPGAPFTAPSGVVALESSRHGSTPGRHGGPVGMPSLKRAAIDTERENRVRSVGTPVGNQEKGSELLLAGPSCRLTDDVREFLWCIAGDGLPLTRRSELHLGDLRRIHEQLPGGGPLDGDQVLLAVARRRAALLQALGDAGQLLEARDGRLRLTPGGWEVLSPPARGAPRPPRAAPPRLRLRRLVGGRPRGPLLAEGRARAAAAPRARRAARRTG